MNPPYSQRLSAYFISLIAFTLSVSSVVAQRPGGRGELPVKAGQQVPEASGVDAEGKPFHLKDLKGSHAVLVFGCLT